MSSTIRLFLAAPNVSAQKGGEAIKALQIFEQLQAVLGDVVQITHIRNQPELCKHPLSQESMAAGLVPICLNWGGPQLLIEHAVSGFLVDPEPLDEIAPALARCMERLAEEPNLAAEMSNNACQQAQQWRWSSLVEQWTAQYASLVGKRARNLTSGCAVLHPPGT
jgi:glycosyltransferase involved in cell wall biosynthesis